MKGNRRRLVGKVTSNKMTKTVVVQVDSRQRHPLYGKVVSRATRFKAHDEIGCKMGDTVRIVESRPISKKVRWVVKEVFPRGSPVVLPDDSALPAAPEPTAPAAAGEGAGPDQDDTAERGIERAADGARRQSGRAGQGKQSHAAPHRRGRRQSTDRAGATCHQPNSCAVRAMRDLRARAMPGGSLTPVRAAPRPPRAW